MDSKQEPRINSRVLETLIKLSDKYGLASLSVGSVTIIRGGVPSVSIKKDTSNKEPYYDPEPQTVEEMDADIYKSIKPLIS